MSTLQEDTRFVKIHTDTTVSWATVVLVQISLWIRPKTKKCETVNLNDRGSVFIWPSLKKKQHTEHVVKKNSLSPSSSAPVNLETVDDCSC